MLYARLSSTELKAQVSTFDQTCPLLVVVVNILAFLSFSPEPLTNFK